MKIVVLDGCHVAQDELNFDILKKYGELTVYYDTQKDEVLDRIKDADIVIENRIELGKTEMDFAKNLKFISTLSTGFNLVDTKYAKEKGIVVSNIPAYSTYAVAQYTIGLLLEIANRTSSFNKFVKDGKWDRFDNPDMWAIKQSELFSKTIGIIGMGDIGYKVAKICETLGMNVLAYKRSPDYSLETETLKFASLDEIYKNSDFISLHLPLTAETTKLINADSISKMKDGVSLINTARGGVIDENALVSALNSGKISFFGADVLTNEPPMPDDMLIATKNTIILPHVAWAPTDTRKRLLGSLEDNIKGFLTGEYVNVVS